MGWRGEFFGGNLNWHHSPERQEIGKARAQRLVKEGLLALG
jgi:hypothetical protein